MEALTLEEIGLIRQTQLTLEANGVKYIFQDIHAIERSPQMYLFLLLFHLWPL